MTVCIAAICNWDGQDEAIVTASDQMISLVHFGADNIASKIDPVHADWRAMFAGEDITKVDLLLDVVRERLPIEKKQNLAHVARAFSFAFKKVKKEMAEHAILSPFGMTLRQFLRDGSKNLGTENFTSILQRIQSVTVGCEFLVCGFDSKREPHIFAMSDDGDPRIYDRAGCWAIGSGQQSALSSLFFHPYNRNFSIWMTSYYVCEAKFMAESAIGVGKTTFLSIFAPEQVRGYILGHFIKEIREEWEKFGKPRVPPNIAEKIQSMIEYHSGDVKEGAG